MRTKVSRAQLIVFAFDFIWKEAKAELTGKDFLFTDPTMNTYPISKIIKECQDKPQRILEIVCYSHALRAALLSDLAERTEKTWTVIAPNRKVARRLAQDIQLFVDPSELIVIPEFDVGPYHRVSSDRKTEMDRLAIFEKITRGEIRVIITSLSAVARKTIPKDDLIARTRTLKVEDLIEDESWRAYLVGNGYTESHNVEDPGTFAIHGDIVDVFSPAHSHPMRLERWGDEIASIKSYNPTTQRTIEEEDTIVIVPVRSENYNSEGRSTMRSKLKSVSKTLGASPQRLRDMLADIRAGLHFVGIDAVLPAFHESLESPLNYLPLDSSIVLFEPEQCFEALENLHGRRKKEYQVAIDEDEFVFPPDAYYLSLAEFETILETSPGKIYLRALDIEGANKNTITVVRSFTIKALSNDVVVQKRMAAGNVEATIDAMQSDLAAWKDTFGRICFTCKTVAQMERLERVLRFSGHDSMRLEPPLVVSEPLAPPTDLIEIYHADLEEGFRSEQLSVAVISDYELFGKKVRVKKASEEYQDRVEINNFKDLAPGDLVVHVDFGIGRYHGLERKTVGEVVADFLYIEYAGGDKLFIPVFRLARIQKYIGNSESMRLDKMGGTSWEKTKEKVKENIREVAGELIELYAQRELQRGIQFSEPGEIFYDFVDDFPYEETPDQQRAIDETIADMQRIRPMDRLVCGDVGFGKTEVAIRAAMKAVEDGRQVAVLVPTTILAEQHVRSFRERLDPFGVRVEGLSRFRTRKQSNQIIEAAAAGKVDVLVGTHRLLSKDIQFRNVGLLIVDEEQRFGVKHKEQLKKFRTNVDSLTLTATPIPRTLQMSLLGIRDLSIISTPPHERLEVRTHIARFNDTIIRDAIVREISRGGQVFFLHNRVKTIMEMKKHLEELIPEARIAVGHGQMGESELEDVMVSYVNNETNVLLCTTIIESGLDIPNANTIIINRADKFGLAQLYQLRGRVGRGKERAYAYLLIPAQGKLNDDAEKRLHVIQTFTALGSGFNVATYDLELRGAGNLLSNSQSGHVAAVGLDLYTELMEEAVAELRGQEGSAKIEPEVMLPIPAYIPEGYVQDNSLRLIFYKRFSLVNNIDELNELIIELEDRFGEVPTEIRNLKDVVHIKIGLVDICAIKLDVSVSTLVLELDKSSTIRPDLVIDWVAKSGGRARIRPGMKMVVSLTPNESANPARTAMQIVQQLQSMKAK